MNVGGDLSLSSKSEEELIAAKEKLTVMAEAAETEKRLAGTVQGKNAAEVKITELKRIQNKIERDLAEVSEGRKGVLGDIAAINGQMLSLMNDQKVRLEAINKLYQAQVSLSGAVAERMNVTGNVDMGEIDKQINDQIASLRKKNEESQRALDISLRTQKAMRAVTGNDPETKGELGKVLNVQAFIAGTIDQKSMDAAAAKLRKLAEDAINQGDKKGADRYLELANMIDSASAANAENLEKTKKLQTDIQNKTKEEAEIRTKVLKVAYQGQLDYLDKMTQKSELQIQLADSLGAGLKASVDMRLEAADAIGLQIGKEEQLLAALDKQAKEFEASNDPEINKKANSIRRDMLDIENQITGQKLKQAQILKTLRDGYVSAIVAMTAGSGMFNKILVTQEKGLGIGLQHLNVLQSKTSGGIGGGKTSPGQFTTGGMSYGDDKQRGYKDYRGAYSNDNNAKNLDLIAQQNARVRAGNGSALGAGAPHMQGAAAGGFRDGGFNGMTKGASEDGDKLNISVAGGEIIMNQRQWPRVAAALGMSTAEFAAMVDSKDYNQLPKFRDGGVVAARAKRDAITDPRYRRREPNIYDASKDPNAQRGNSSAYTSMFGGGEDVSFAPTSGDPVPLAPQTPVTSVAAPKTEAVAQSGKQSSPYWNGTGALPIPTKIDGNYRPLDAQGNIIAREGWVYENGPDGRRWYSPAEVADIKNEVGTPGPKAKGPIFGNSGKKSSVGNMGAGGVGPSDSSSSGTSSLRKGKSGGVQDFAYEANAGLGKWYVEQERKAHEPHRRLMHAQLDAQNGDEDVRRGGTIEEARYAGDLLSTLPESERGGLSINSLPREKIAWLKQYKEKLSSSRKARDGAYIPRFEYGGTVPDVGSSQKGMLDAMGMGSAVGERTLALVRAGEQILPASQARGKAAAGASQPAGGNTANLNFDLGGIRVDYGNLGQVGTLIKQKVDGAVSEIFKQMSGQRSGLPRSNV